MGNDWFYEYFINELKAIGRKHTSKLSYEVVDTLPSSGNEQTIYFVKSDSSSSNNHYDEYVWISSSTTFEKIGSAQIDGSTTNPDWNQNDDTKPDYIKNRPFYTGDPVETVLVEESTVAFELVDGSDGSDMYVADFPSTFEATVGETYKVSWDGTVYECVSEIFMDMPAIGNLSIVGAGSDTGEPFIMLVFNGEGIQIGTADASSSHTFSISTMVAPVIKIDKKYLVQPDWNQNDETAADFVKNRTHYESSNLITKEMTFLSAAGSDGLTQNDIEFANALFEHQDGLSISENGTLLNNSHIEATDDYICFYVLELETTVPTLFCELRLSNGAPTGDIRVSDLTGNQKWKNVVLTLEYEETVIHPLDEKYLPDTLRPFKPAGKSYLTFSSLSSFTLAVADATKHWNGTLEYFASDKTWTTWDGTGTLSAVYDNGEYILYLRGAGNTVITGSGIDSQWILTGTDIKCTGNIENLLNYATVESGAHPTTENNCYAHMFYGCSSLTQAPTLPATTLAISCYNSMFQRCTSLTQAPALPATTLASSCYQNMFQGCTSLTQAPALPATKLATQCYYSMFQGCTSLTHAPALPATTLANQCYYGMFQRCTSLTQAPALPATTLASYCYTNMFQGCTSLTQAPALPATTLASYCYSNMFQGCSSLAQAPALSATTLKDVCYYSMFQGCTSLTHAPALPATTLATQCYQEMFQGCTSLTQAPALPATTLATQCYYDMFSGCTNLKLSSTKTDEYTQEYRIPSSGNGTTANAFRDMFASTGGTFAGTPSINTTYYLSSNNMIVRETEIATLNGYVDSMIDTAIGEYADTAEYIIHSSTEGSTKKFKITVDDSGVLTATEVT